METIASPPKQISNSYGRLFVLLGLALGLAAPIAYVIQIRANILATPWYLPPIGTAGAILIFLGISRKRSIWRILGMILLAFLAVFEWAFLLKFSLLPAYAGPVAAGKPFPAFATSLADGTDFTQAQLQGDNNTVMVFFRGRW